MKTTVDAKDIAGDLTVTVTILRCRQWRFREAIEFDNRVHQDYKQTNLPSIVKKNEGPDDEYDMKLDNALFQEGFILLEPEPVLSSEPEPPFQGDPLGDKKPNYH